MTNYAIFLRGINVGGINIKMADLREALAAVPLEDVRTILASGNVIAGSDLTAAKLKATVEATLRERFGYDAWVIILTRERVAELVAACPYASDDPGTHAYVTLGSESSALDDLSAAATADDPDGDQLRLGPEAIAWTAPVGGTLESTMSKLTAMAKFKRTTTTRNVRTLLKVIEADIG